MASKKEKDAKKNLIFKPEEIKVGSQTWLRIKILREDQWVAWAVFCPMDQPGRLRLYDVYAEPRLRFPKSFAITRAFNLAREWGAKNGYNHIEYGSRERNNFGKIPVKSKKKMAPKRPR